MVFLLIFPLILSLLSFPFTLLSYYMCNSVQFCISPLSLLRLLFHCRDTRKSFLSLFRVREILLSLDGLENLIFSFPLFSGRVSYSVVLMEKFPFSFYLFLRRTSPFFFVCPQGDFLILFCLFSGRVSYSHLSGFQGESHVRLFSGRASYSSVLLYLFLGKVSVSFIHSQGESQSPSYVLKGSPILFSHLFSGKTFHLLSSIFKESLMSPSSILRERLILLYLFP